MFLQRHFWMIVDCLLHVMQARGPLISLPSINVQRSCEITRCLCVVIKLSNYFDIL